MKCYFCKKEIDNYKFKTNEGIYCKDCYKIGLIIQTNNLRKNTIDKLI